MIRAALPWALGTLVAAVVLGGPGLYYRATYEHARRLRVVADGVLYRCGQLPAAGFRDAHRKYGFKTVVNLQEEARDPLLPPGVFRKPAVRETEVLADLGARYVCLDGGVLDHPDLAPGSRPAVIDEFLELMDDPGNRPVLIHCKAGLHRTGLMVAVYRMEYERRSAGDAMEELKANGFGTFAATDGNAYVQRYVTAFRPGVRWPHGKPTKPARPAP
jgi:tyrosine-protein phosphatase SIW14